MKMNSKDEKIKEGISKAIFDEFKSITNDLPRLTKEEPTLINIIPIMSQYYNCNVVVHEVRGLDYLIYCHPSSQNYRHDWPRIDLLQKVDPDKEFAHITLIRGAFNNPMYKMREERGYPMSLLSIQELLNDS